VEFADQDRQLLDLVHAVDEILRWRPAILVHAVDIETARERDDVVRRCAAKADAEVEMIRVVPFQRCVDHL
jgi:hypothetical protein